MVIKFFFTPEKLRKHWGNGKSLTYKGKRYRVGKMSYGDYFLEPVSFKGGESSGHSKNTKWLEKKTFTNRYGAKQVVYVVE